MTLVSRQRNQALAPVKGAGEKTDLASLRVVRRAAGEAAMTRSEGPAVISLAPARGRAVRQHSRRRRPRSTKQDSLTKPE